MREVRNWEGSYPKLARETPCQARAMAVMVQPLLTHASTSRVPPCIHRRAASV